MNRDEELESIQHDLADFVENVPIPMHWVGPDGRILWANRAELELLGYGRDEYVGRNISDFHADAAVITDILARLCNQEELREREATLRAKDGSLRHVRISSNVFWRDGEFVHTRCFTRDVTSKRRAEEARAAAIRRTERLTLVTAAIANAVTAEQVFDAVVDHVAMALQASSAALWLVSDDGTHASMVRSIGYPESARSVFRDFPIQAGATFPALDVIRTGEALWIPSQQELVARYPHLAALVSQGRSYQVSCLPIVVHGRTIGSLGFTFEDDRTFDADEQGLLMLVARYSAQAIERLRLLVTERQSRALAEAGAARMELLGRVSAAFVEATPDLPTLLQAVVSRITLDYADVCAILLRSEQEDDRLDVVAVDHRDPAEAAAIREALAATPLRVGEGVAGRVVATGEPLFVPKVDLAALQQTTSAALSGIVGRSRAHSLVMMPLRVRGRVFGALSAVRNEGAPSFTVDDRRLLEELAERASLAIESSRLYRDNEAGRRSAELLYEMAAAVIGAENIQEVFEAALDAIGSALGAQRASILSFDTEGVMRFRAWRGLSERYRKAVEGHSPWSADVRAPDPIVVADVEAAPSMAPLLRLFHEEKIGAVAFIPLVAGGRLMGKFMVYYAERRTLSESELDMARAIANNVAAAIARFSAVAELQQTVRFNEMFTAILGHDLRNPLGAIMAAAELAARRDEDDKFTKPVSRILRSGARMARMIDQLLDFTRVRVGSGIPILPTRIDLIPVLREAMDELDERNPSCSLHFEHGGGDTIGIWDADRLSQVFSNLVANAVKHGTADQPVTVRVDGGENGTLRVAVHNRGTIPPSLLPTLFLPMAGADRPRDKSDGLGLGLFISQQILKAHGGRIEVRSSDDDGTVFQVWLPRVAPGAKVTP